MSTRRNADAMLPFAAAALLSLGLTGCDVERRGAPSDDRVRELIRHHVTVADETKPRHVRVANVAFQCRIKVGLGGRVLPFPYFAYRARVYSGVPEAAEEELTLEPYWSNSVAYLVSKNRNGEWSVSVSRVNGYSCSG